MPARFSARTQAIVYAFIAERDGEKCFLCGDPPPCITSRTKTGQTQITYQRLDIDHIDHDKSNASPSNLQLLCRRCNVIKERRRKPQHSNRESVCVSEQSAHHRTAGDIDRGSMTRLIRSEIDFSEAGPIGHANAIMEVTFRAWLLDRLDTQLIMRKTEARDAGAEAAGCSPETAKRYLSKITSGEGPLQIIKDHLGRLHVVQRARLDEVKAADFSRVEVPSE